VDLVFYSFLYFVSAVIVMAPFVYYESFVPILIFVGTFLSYLFDYKRLNRFTHN
jgi:hypothetical protein